MTTHTVMVDDDIKEINEGWSDNKKEDQRIKNKNHRLWNENILIAVGSEEDVFFLMPNFEKELGLSGDDSQKVDQALSHFQNIVKEDIPECLLNPINRLLKL